MGGLRGKRQVGGDEEPPWARNHGLNVVKEYATASSPVIWVPSCHFDDTDVSRWHVKMKEFDAASPGGAQLNCDLTGCTIVDVEGCLTRDSISLRLPHRPSIHPRRHPAMRVVHWARHGGRQRVRRGVDADPRLPSRVASAVRHIGHARDCQAHHDPRRTRHHSHRERTRRHRGTAQGGSRSTVQLLRPHRAVFSVSGEERVRSLARASRRERVVRGTESF